MGFLAVPGEQVKRARVGKAVNAGSEPLAVQLSGCLEKPVMGRIEAARWLALQHITTAKHQGELYGAVMSAEGELDARKQKGWQGRLLVV